MSPGFSAEQVMEFDDEETVAGLVAGIAANGHRVERIGCGVELARRLAAGERWDLVFDFAEGVRGRSREAQVPALCEMFDQPYTFSVGGAASGSVTVSSYNNFKTDSVVRGLGQSQITTFSAPGATAVLKNTKGTVLDTAVSDQDGRCIFNYKSSPKATTFYVTLIPPAGSGTAQTKAITLKPNGDVEVGLFNTVELPAGVRLAGPVPAPFADFTYFETAVLTKGAVPLEAAAFISRFDFPIRTSWPSGIKYSSFINRRRLLKNIERSRNGPSAKLQTCRVGCWWPISKVSPRSVRV